VYHDATFDKERAQDFIQQRSADAADRAVAEQIYLATISAVARIAQKDRDEYFHAHR